ncbi:hypothetical protein [Streptomyces sp. enrichment culture]|uniref:hypothetical protein n=1 Tax=Streptomyces sp. enrichment culture TaxID=1795815 RepID=UPI003F55E5A7
MSEITQIKAHVMTADVEHAATGAWIYLGVGGREFVLDLAGKSDFAQGADDTYVFGDGANVENAQYNDPRTPPLDTDDLQYFPVYLRFESSQSGAAWCLEWVLVTVNEGQRGERSYEHPSLRTVNERHRIWLDNSYGKAVYLRPRDNGPQ